MKMQIRNLIILKERRQKKFYFAARKDNKFLVIRFSEIISFQKCFFILVKLCSGISCKYNQKKHKRVSVLVMDC